MSGRLYKRYIVAYITLSDNLLIYNSYRVKQYFYEESGRITQMNAKPYRITERIC